MNRLAATRVAVASMATRVAAASMALVVLAAGPGPRAQSGEAAPEPGSAHLSAVSALSSDDQWRQPTDVIVKTRDTDLDGVEGPRVGAVRETVRRSLGERGIAVGPDGSHVLHFMVTMAPAPAPPDEPTTMDDPYLPPTASYRSLDVVNQVTVPLGEGAGNGVSSHFSISFMLFVPGEKPLWHATITASGEVEEPVELLRGMTRAAMDALGRNEERTFMLSCAGADARCLP